MSSTPPTHLGLKVITPQSLAVTADVHEVMLPSLDGLVGIWPGHRPMVLALGRGRLMYREHAEEEVLAVRGGYAEVRPDAVLVFTELADEEDDSAEG